MSKNGLYFWTSYRDKRLRFGDERLVKTGITHSVKGDLRPCFNGLHASKRLIDALTFIPGSYIWLVSLSDERIEGKRKACARSRTYIAGFNAEKMISAFARKYVMRDVKRIQPFCNSRHYALVFDWLLTGGDELRMAARRVSNYVASSTENSAQNLPAYVAARAIIMLTTYPDVVSVKDFLRTLACLKGRASPSNKDYAQANKMLMGMLPNRIKTILAQHEQGEQL